MRGPLTTNAVVSPKLTVSTTPASAGHARPQPPSGSVTVRRRRRPTTLEMQVDDVHPEAVDAAVEPVAHHRVDRLPDLGVLPVEVGLLGGEHVQVVLAGAAS